VVKALELIPEMFYFFLWTDGRAPVYALAAQNKVLNRFNESGVFSLGESHPRILFFYVDRWPSGLRQQS